MGDVANASPPRTAWSTARGDIEREDRRRRHVVSFSPWDYRVRYKSLQRGNTVGYSLSVSIPLRRGGSTQTCETPNTSQLLLGVLPLSTVKTRSPVQSLSHSTQYAGVAGVGQRSSAHVSVSCRLSRVPQPLSATIRGEERLNYCTGTAAWTNTRVPWFHDPVWYDMRRQKRSMHNTLPRNTPSSMLRLPSQDAQWPGRSCVLPVRSTRLLVTAQ
jgi:hypothetical protein